MEHHTNPTCKSLSLTPSRPCPPTCFTPPTRLNHWEGGDFALCVLWILVSCEPKPTLRSLFPILCVLWILVGFNLNIKTFTTPSALAKTKPSPPTSIDSSYVNALLQNMTSPYQIRAFSFLCILHHENYISRLETYSGKASMASECRISVRSW